MPIYGYEFIGGNPWVVVTSIERKTLIKLRKVLKNAKTSFEYCKEIAFCKSVKDNEEMKDLYIASFDISGTNMDQYRYQTYVEALIRECNYLLSMNYKYKKYKFDIIGQYYCGKIIIMEKK